jgi:uncharacterized coiled-coil DUF342 family protein
MIHIDESSRLNPGKRMIIGSMIGSAGATAVVKASQEALKSWPELDRKKKSEVLNKLKELKAKAKETLSADLSAAPAEKKTAAREKADAVDQQFKAAVKKRTAKEETGDNSKKIESLKAEREKINDSTKQILDEFDKMNKEMESRKLDPEEIEGMLAKAEPLIAKLEKFAKQADDIDKSIAELEGTNESFLNMLPEMFLYEMDISKAVDKANSIVAAIEDKSNGGSGNGDNSKKEKLQKEIEELKKEIEDTKADIKEKWSEQAELRNELKDFYDDRDSYKKDGDDEDAEMAQMQIDRIKGEIEEIEDTKTMLKHQLEEYEEGLAELKDELKSLGESSSHKFTKHVMLFEQFINKLY